MRRHLKEQSSENPDALDKGYQLPTEDSLTTSSEESRSYYSIDHSQLKSPEQLEYPPTHSDFDEQYRFLYTDKSDHPISMLYIRKDYIRAEQYIITGHN